MVDRPLDREESIDDKTGGLAHIGPRLVCCSRRYAYTSPMTISTLLCRLEPVGNDRFTT